MGLFAKRKPRDDRTAGAARALAEFDESWFQRWIDSILEDAGVAPDDGQNRFQVIMFLLDLTLDKVAVGEGGFFDHTGDEAARRAYSRLVAEGAGPAERFRYLAHWNPDTVEILRQRLEQHRAVLVEGGRRHGRMRFFPSDCCGVPIEFSLDDGAAFCSGCGQPR